MQNTQRHTHAHTHTLRSELIIIIRREADQAIANGTVFAFDSSFMLYCTDHHKIHTFFHHLLIRLFVCCCCEHFNLISSNYFPSPMKLFNWIHMIDWLTSKRLATDRFHLTYYHLKSIDSISMYRFQWRRHVVVAHWRPAFFRSIPRTYITKKTCARCRAYAIPRLKSRVCFFFTWYDVMRFIHVVLCCAQMCVMWHTHWV